MNWIQLRTWRWIDWKKVVSESVAQRSQTISAQCTIICTDLFLKSSSETITHFYPLMFCILSAEGSRRHQPIISAHETMIETLMFRYPDGPRDPRATSSLCSPTKKSVWSRMKKNVVRTEQVLWRPGDAKPLAAQQKHKKSVPHLPHSEEQPLEENLFSCCALLNSPTFSFKSDTQQQCQQKSAFHAMPCNTITITNNAVSGLHDLNHSMWKF